MLHYITLRLLECIISQLLTYNSPKFCSLQLGKDDFYQCTIIASLRRAAYYHEMASPLYKKIYILKTLKYYIIKNSVLFPSTSTYACFGVCLSYQINNGKILSIFHFYFNILFTLSWQKSCDNCKPSSLR